ncbi:unnamed protein product, partial [Cyprideis torosa]
IEKLMNEMQEEKEGLRVRTVKSLRSKIPSVFTGAELVLWFTRRFGIDEQEALHLAGLIAAHGYIFSIEDHSLTVKADGTYYRFQTPYYWPSKWWEPENTDYAIYLCKRTMQKKKTKMELSDYEAEKLAHLQRMFSQKWEFIFMQAEAQSKVDKKRDKLERKILDSQERAFWDVYRPMPGCVNAIEIDIKKTYRMKLSKPPEPKGSRSRGGASGARGSGSASCKESLQQEISLLKRKLDRINFKVSKAAESFIAYFAQYREYDPFVTTPEPSNPWISDNVDLWDAEKQAKDISAKRVRRWAFSIHELLKDPVGRDHFVKFLEKEYSGENLKFWEDVQALRRLPEREVKEYSQKIWDEYLGPEATSTVNIDSQSHETTRKNIADKPDRWAFDIAAGHVFHLMRCDTYSRYIRSDMYKDFLNGSKKKCPGSEQQVKPPHPLHPPDSPPRTHRSSQALPHSKGEIPPQEMKAEFGCRALHLTSM